MKLEECLAVNDNQFVEGEDSSAAPRRINAPVVRRPGRGKSATRNKKPQTRRNRKVSSSEGSSDGELENQPPQRQKGRNKKERIIQSDSDDEPVTRKKVSVSRLSRATKVVQDPTSSGKKRLSENNSF